MTDANDKSDKHIDSSQVTSWSPCHVGRAIAIAEGFAGVSAFTDEKGLLFDGRGAQNVYGSDVGGHLDLLAKREREGVKSRNNMNPIPW